MTAETTSLSLITAMTAGVSFDIPVVDLSAAVFDLPGDETSELYTQIVRIPLSDIVSEDVDGNAAFDVMMRSGKAHLVQEFEENRITGAEYTKAYIAMMELAMQNATSFILAREQTFWQAQKGQAEAITGRTGLELAKLEVAKLTFEANTAKANYADTVLGLAVTDMKFNTAEYSLNTLLPKQGLLLDEQVETARAQTLDTRTDGITTIVGTVGKQKDLYTQQITSYQRDSEIKAAKVFGDTWITQKTIDEGLTAPSAFTNASLDEVFETVKTNLNFGP